MELSAQQLHILQHSLGVDQYGRGSQYRRHFVTGEGSLDHADCVTLTALGLMTRKAGNQLTGDMDYFLVTEAGRTAMTANSPSPPKLTRSQKRYRAWLDADCEMSFIDYAKACAS